jgi:hypothetical protein
MRVSFFLQLVLLFGALRLDQPLTPGLVLKNPIEIQMNVTMSMISFKSALCILSNIFSSKLMEDTTDPNSFAY